MTSEQTGGTVEPERTPARRLADRIMISLQLHPDEQSPCWRTTLPPAQLVVTIEYIIDQFLALNVQPTQLGRGPQSEATP